MWQIILAAVQRYGGRATGWLIGGAAATYVGEHASKAIEDWATFIGDYKGANAVNFAKAIDYPGILRANGVNIQGLTPAQVAQALKSGIGSDGKPLRPMTPDEIQKAIDVGYRSDGRPLMDADGITPLGEQVRDEFVKQFTNTRNALRSVNEADKSAQDLVTANAQARFAFINQLGQAAQAVGSIVGSAITYGLLIVGAGFLFNWLKDTDWGKSRPWVGAISDKLNAGWDTITEFFDGNILEKFRELLKGFSGEVSNLGKQASTANNRSVTVAADGKTFEQRWENRIGDVRFGQLPLPKTTAPLTDRAELPELPREDAARASTAPTDFVSSAASNPTPEPRSRRPLNGTLAANTPDVVQDKKSASTANKLGALAPKAAATPYSFSS